MDKQKNQPQQNKELLDNIIKTLDSINKTIGNLQNDVNQIKEKIINKTDFEDFEEVNKSWFF